MGKLNLELARPLDLLEVVGMGDAPLIRNRRTFAMYVRQMTDSEAVSVRTDAGDLVAIVGACQQDFGAWEIFLMEGPALKANLRRLILDLRGHAQMLREVFAMRMVAYIDPASVAGGRIAAILGFHPCGLTDSPIGPLETWRRS